MNKEVLLQAAGLCLLLAGNSSVAADRLGRLTVEVRVEGAQSWQMGQDYSNSRISEQYKLVTTVKSDGQLDSVNTKDPQFAQKQMTKAAGVQKAVREAQARSGTAVPRAPATQEEYLAQQKKLAEDMQKGQAACKGEMNCLMKLAQDYSQKSAMITAPGAAAESAEAVDGEEDVEDDRYMNFFGYEGCPGEIQIRINNTSEGATADVSGMVPFKQSDTADYRGTELNRKMQCLGSNLVYDTKARKIYTDGIGHPTPRGSYRYWDRLHGETLNKDTDITTHTIAWEWVVKNLWIAEASGSATATLPATKTPLVGATREGSRVSGQIKVHLNWKFELL